MYFIHNKFDTSVHSHIISSKKIYTIKSKYIYIYIQIISGVVETPSAATCRLP